MPPLSEAWFDLGAERVEWLLEVDCAAALRVATELWEAGRGSHVVGAAEAMAALAQLACARLEGPIPAQVWQGRCDPLPAATPPRLRVHSHFALARCLCYAERHGDELAHSIPGQAAAEQVGDLVLRLRAAMLTLHTTPTRGLASLRRLFAEAEAGPRPDVVAVYRPWLLLEEYKARTVDGPLESAAALLDAAEALGRAQGNRRLLGTVHSFRAAALVDSDPKGALAHLEQASDLFRLLADRRELGATLDVRAFLTRRIGETEHAITLLEEGEALVAGRGYTTIEDQLQRTRLDFAVRAADGPTAARLAEAIDARRAARVEIEQQVRETRARLREAEEARDLAEQGLRDAEARSVAEIRERRVWSTTALTAGMAVLVGLFWHGRRRLQRVNRRLAEEIEHVHAARREQAQLEERLRGLERAQGLGTMAAGVAHDFNNLLTGILGNAELIAEALPNTDAAAFAQSIRQSGRHAARLCKQLQTYAGGAPLQPAPIDLVAALRSLVPVLRSACGDAIDVRLVAEVESLGAVADAAALDQALLNLATNARDAKARTVTIRVGRVPSAAGEAGPGRIVIEVVDDGEGMTPEVAERVFDPFFTTRFPGRGLGLAVVSGIVQRHGGSIGVRSELGRGSTFRIELPGAAPPGATAEPTVVLPSLPPPAVPATILLVDDDEHVRAILVRMLRFLGREAAPFGAGAACVQAAAAAPVDRPLVAFVDLTMPAMDGTEVLRQLRQVRPDARIALMSGHADSHVGQMASTLRPDCVLAKPFQLEALRATLGSLLNPSSPSVPQQV
ncbi:MAG: response regulator [Planctomycetes bacterium]|nr:response regulator [Planctomycetota bacterium]